MNTEGLVLVLGVLIGVYSFVHLFLIRRVVQEIKKINEHVKKIDFETDQVAQIIFDNHMQINQLKADKEDTH